MAYDRMHVATAAVQWKQPDDRTWRDELSQGVKRLVGGRKHCSTME